METVTGLFDELDLSLCLSSQEMWQELGLDDTDELDDTWRAQWESGASQFSNPSTPLTMSSWKALLENPARNWTALTKSLKVDVFRLPFVDVVAASTVPPLPPNP